jgi:predicted 3-demethylubiquinone-9 3-methyltransferase (glyoxalase superfamily)
MTAFQKITPCLWFDSEAEEAARFYVSVFRKEVSPDVTLSPAAPEGSVGPCAVKVRMDGIAGPPRRHGRSRRS